MIVQPYSCELKGDIHESLYSPSNLRGLQSAGMKVLRVWLDGASSPQKEGAAFRLSDCIPLRLVRFREPTSTAIPHLSLTKFATACNHATMTQSSIGSMSLW